MTEDDKRIFNGINIHQVIVDPRLTHVAKVLYFGLIILHDGNPEKHARIKELHTLTHIAAGSIKHNLTILQDAGYILYTKRQHPETAQPTTYVEIIRHLD